MKDMTFVSGQSKGHAPIQTERCLESQELTTQVEGPKRKSEKETVMSKSLNSALAVIGFSVSFKTVKRKPKCRSKFKTNLRGICYRKWELLITEKASRTRKSHFSQNSRPKGRNEKLKTLILSQPEGKPAGNDEWGCSSNYITQDRKLKQEAYLIS